MLHRGTKTEIYLSVKEGKTLGKEIVSVSVKVRHPGLKYGYGLTLGAHRHPTFTFQKI